MTNVCTVCGWLVLDAERCPRCAGLAIAWRKAARACGVSTLRGMLNVPPAGRVHAFTMARARRAAGKNGASPSGEAIAAR